MATRVYFDDTLWVGVTPSSWLAGWNATSGSSRYLFISKFAGSPDGIVGNNTVGTGVSGQFKSAERWLLGPLAGQTISGTVKGQSKVAETNATDNYTVAIGIKVIKPDGTDRGVLLAVTASDDTSATPPECAVTTRTNRRFLDSSESAAITLSSVDVVAGDYLVVERGFRQASTSVADFLYNYGFLSSNTDLGENDTSTSTTEADWLEFSQDISVISYFGSSASLPPDNDATGQAEPVTAALTPPSGMIAGDLVVMVGQLQVASTGQITVSNNGGQSWSSIAEVAANDQVAAITWCQFDGTWDANPSLAFAAQSGTQPATAVMHVFRGPSGRDWAVDTAFAGAAEAAATTVTIPGITPNNDNNITLAVWCTADDNTWSNLSGTGWVDIGQAQVRNLAGGDQSMTQAYQPQATKAATNDVSKDQSGSDAGVSFTMAWYAVSEDRSVTGVSGSIRYTGNTPTVFTELPRNVTAVSGAIRYTGQTPTAFTENKVDVAAASGAIIYAGQTPSAAVTNNTFINAVSGAIVYAGQTPTVARTENQDIAAVAGAIRYAGQTPSVSTAESVDINAVAGAIVYTGQTPSVARTENQDIAAVSGAIVYTGQLAVVATDDSIAIEAVSGSIIYTGQVPLVEVSIDQLPVEAPTVVAGRPARRMRRRLLCKINGEVVEIEDVNHLFKLLKECKKDIKGLAYEKAQEIVRTGRRVSEVREQEPRAVEVIDAPRAAMDAIEERIREMESYYWLRVSAGVKQIQRDDEETLFLMGQI